MYKRDNQDLTSYECPHDRPQRPGPTATDPGTGRTEKRSRNEATKEVEAVGLCLHEKLGEIPSPAEMTGQYGRESSIEAGECHEGAGETHECPARHRPTVHCREQSDQKPGSTQVADPGSQPSFVPLEQPGRHAESRRKEEAEQHPSPIHDASLVTLRPRFTRLRSRFGWAGRCKAPPPPLPSLRGDRNPSSPAGVGRTTSAHGRSPGTWTHEAGLDRTRPTVAIPGSYRGRGAVVRDERTAGQGKPAGQRLNPA